MTWTKVEVDEALAKLTPEQRLHTTRLLDQAQKNNTEVMTASVSAPSGVSNPEGKVTITKPKKAKLSSASSHDPVNHPKHYTEHPSGVECIQITEHMGFNLGNALKYIWRADLKNNAIEDLQKAVWYINREIEKRSK